MSLDFPNTPTNGQTFTGPDGAVWVYDGVKWKAQAGVASISSGTGITATPNPITGTGTIALTVPVAVSSGGTGSTTAGAATSNNVGRNILHNPLFNIVQRGVGPFTFNGGYTLDRWLMSFSNDTGVSVSQSILSDSIRTQIGDESATNCLTVAFTGNAAATAFTLLDQPIEDVRRLGGKTITVSFYAASNAGTPKLGVSLDQLFGSGGSAPVTLAGQSVTLSTTWTRYSLTFAVPSISGKTINTGNYTSLDFWYSSGTNQATRAGSIGVQSGTINIWGVQLEIGSTMTPLEKPDPQQDLANCQRFYQIGIAWAQYPASAIGNLVGNTYSFSVTMRATPTVTAGSSSNTNLSSFTLSALGNMMVGVYGNATAAGPVGIYTNFMATADL